MLCHEGICMAEFIFRCHILPFIMAKCIEKVWHKNQNLFNSSINDGELMKMNNEEKQKTTIRINPEVWELARAKAKCSGSKLIEELLIDYIGNDSNIIVYEDKIAESEEIIRQEKTKIKQYKKAISLLEKEMMKNGEDIKLLGECSERIKQYHSRYKFVSVQFLLRLSKIKNMPMDKLTDICHYNEFEIKSIKEPKK